MRWYAEDYLIAGFFGFLGLAVLWLVVAGFIMAVASKDCLERGLPDVYVAWDLTTYCVGIDGAVENRVEER